MVSAELSREYDMQEEVTSRAEEIFRRIPVQRIPREVVPVRIDE